MLLSADSEHAALRNPAGTLADAELAPVAVAAEQAAGAETPVVVNSDALSTVRVSYADLNLGSLRGRERLYGRVTAAVRAMCQDDNFDSLKVQMAEQHCYANSIREAGDRIDQALKARSTGLATGPHTVGIVRR